MIGIINYRVGNIYNLQNALNQNGIESIILNSPDSLDKADKLILPGVGAFQYAMQNLRKYGFEEPLKEMALKKPILGICVGMQLLFTEGFEQGCHRGLNIIQGCVKKLNVPLKIPHMGWNLLNINPALEIFSGLSKQVWVYYVHSYVCQVEDSNVTIGESEYGIPFPGAVKKNQIYGFQFHPEKSYNDGLRLLKNFCELNPC